MPVTKTNLSTLPRPEPDSSADQIARINELSKTARGIWFSLLGYLAFVGVTLLAVEDADFFIDSRQTQLPLIGVSIPTSSFFFFGPVLGTSLFVYLHIYLTRLWDTIADAPPPPNGLPLSEAVTPWLINDFAIALRHDKKKAFRTRSLSWISHSVTVLLVFIAGPLVMGYFWVRHWPSHDFWTNAALAVFTAITLGAAVSSLYSAYYRLRLNISFKGKFTSHFAAIAPFVVLAFGLIALSELKTGRDRLDQLNARTDRWSVAASRALSMSSAQLAEVQFVTRPPDWHSYKDRKAAFHREFCKREGLSPQVCGPIDPNTPTNPAEQTARQNWVSEMRIPNPARFFANLNDRFQTAWEAQHEGDTTDQSQINLRGKDFRQSDLSFSYLVGADLRSAKFDRAVLSYAQLEGVNLARASLHRASMNNVSLDGANLAGTIMTEAYLSNATFRSTDFFDANLADARVNSADLSHARFSRAILTGTHFWYANIENAVFSSSNLTLTEFNQTDLQGASFQGSELDGTLFQRPNLRYAKWFETTLKLALHNVDLRGSIGLTQDLLKDVIGDERTLLWAADNPSGPVNSLHVWSCWEPDRIPQTIDTIINREFRRYVASRDALRDLWVCSEDNPRYPTGTVISLGAEERFICTWQPDFTCRATNGNVVAVADRP